MADLLQTLIITITLGSLYALIALGYTMVYGVLKLINFAHSDVVVLGAWTSVVVASFVLPFLGFIDLTQLWWSGPVVLVVSMAACGLIGFLIERFAYRPIRKAPRLNALITAIGVSLLLQNAGQLQFNLIDNESVVARGPMLERSSANPKSVRLDADVTLSADQQFVVRVIRSDAKPDKSGNVPRKSFRVVAPAGAYAKGTDIAIDTTIGRSDTRAANFELVRVAPHPPLKLPFGASPAKVPNVLPEVDLWSHTFVSETSFGQVKRLVRITLLDALIVVTAVTLMGLLQVLVYHTRVGTAMRAVSYNMDTAALMGIPVDRIVSITFVTGTMLAAAAGFLIALKYQQIQQPAHTTWVLLGLKAFVAAVVGGIGNIRGATAGGFLIAIIEQFGAYAGQLAGWDNASAYTDVFVFALLIVVLLVKPTGLFGTSVREKV